MKMFMRVMAIPMTAFRARALKEFRNTASEELKSLGGELKDTMVTIGLKMFQTSETVLSDVVGG